MNSRKRSSVVAAEVGTCDLGDADALADGDGAVIAIPTERYDADAPWHYDVERRGGDLTFTGQVLPVDGAEGERIRGELATVSHKMLAWAADRRRADVRENSTGADIRDDQAA